MAIYTLSSSPLSKFSQELPEDQQSLLSEIYLTPEYMSILNDLKIDEEWNQSIDNLKQISITGRIDQITKELDRLDSQSNKTEEDEKRQAELLQEIVLLKRK